MIWLVAPCFLLQREIGKVVDQICVFLYLDPPAPLVLTLHTQNRSGEAVVLDGRYCSLHRRGKPGANVRMPLVRRQQMHLTSSATSSTT